MFTARFGVLLGMIFVAAATRLLPHPPNFTPIEAMALFGGTYFAKRMHAFLVPFVAMVLSDLFLGLHMTLGFVYFSFLVTLFIGFSLRTKPTLLRTSGAVLASSVLFFFVTNFGVWMMYETYPKTVAGLITCYVAAIPFFQNTLYGDLFYSVLLFGGFALAKRLIPSLEIPGQRASATF